MNNLPKLIEKPVFKKRKKDTHKGTYGTALSICGSPGMAGAAYFAGMSALRSGIGLLKCAVPQEIYPVLASMMPEAIFINYEKNSEALKKEIINADSVLIGCGLSKSPESLNLLKLAAVNCKSTLIIDADGINLLAENIDILGQKHCNTVLTPHPKEMSRLLGVDVSFVQSHREECAIKASKMFNSIVVLKGNKTLVAGTDGELFINNTGNPGMAVGGSGDLLAGMVLGLSAKSENLLKTVCDAVYLHGMCGDLTAQRLGEISMLPSDMLNVLPECFKIG